MYRRNPYRAVALTVAIGLALASTARSDEERAALLQASDEAKNLIVHIKGHAVEGAGVAFAVEGQTILGVTARHVVFKPNENPAQLEFRFKMWRQALKLVAAADDTLPLRGHPQQDLAVFRIDAAPLGLAQSELTLALGFDRLGDTSTLDPGAAIYTIGHAPGGTWLDSKAPGRLVGVEAFANPKQRDTLKLEHFCPPGHSGGGVFDQHWQLIGMIFDNQQPYCRGLRVETILAILQGWNLDAHWRQPPSNTTAHEAVKHFTVAVVDFDNRSGSPLPEIGAAACDIVTSFLFNMPKVTVVTRDRLNTVLREQRLSPTQLSSAGYSRIGHLLDADAVVTGSVTRYDVERRGYRNRGVNVLSDTYRMSITLQIIDIQSGIVRFSKDYDIRDVKAYTDAAVAPRRPQSRESELLRKLLTNEAVSGVQHAVRELTAGLSTSGKLIAMAIRSKPAGADISIGGVYYGKTPMDLDLSLGEHLIELKLPGYAPWEHRVNVEPGRNLDATLSPRADGG